MKAIVIHAAKDLRMEERGAEKPEPGQAAAFAGPTCITSIMVALAPFASGNR